MSQDKRILRETKACETVAGLEKRCLVLTEYQLLYYTEIDAFDRCAELLVVQHCVFSTLISYGTKNVRGIYNVLH